MDWQQTVVEEEDVFVATGLFLTIEKVLLDPASSCADITRFPR